VDTAIVPAAVTAVSAAVAAGAIAARAAMEIARTAAAKADPSSSYAYRASPIGGARSFI
jgi:hypothetical protein